MPTTKKTTNKEEDEKKASAIPPLASRGTKKSESPKGEYYSATGRRKSAVATVKLWIKGDGAIIVNGMANKEFFKVYELQEQVMSPLKSVGMDEAHVEIRTSGGGPRGQAEAARLGISRALLKINEENRKTLKPLGFLTRDPRKKERKKPGLKKARKAPQWSKR